MISLIMPPKDQVSSLFRDRKLYSWQNALFEELLAFGDESILLPEGCTHVIEVACSFVQVSRVQKMLGDELGTASNIKSRVNRQSVLGAITSAQQRLKLYNKACHHPAHIKFEALFFLEDKIFIGDL